MGKDLKSAGIVDQKAITPMAGKLAKLEEYRNKLQTEMSNPPSNFTDGLHNMFSQQHKTKAVKLHALDKVIESFKESTRAKISDPEIKATEGGRLSAIVGEVEIQIEHDAAINIEDNAT